MPIVGEQVFRWDWSAENGASHYVEFNFASPTAVLAKGSLVRTTGWGQLHESMIWIESIKHKRSDGLIEKVDINSLAVYDNNMTSIKYFVHSLRTNLSAMMVFEF